VDRQDHFVTSLLKAQLGGEPKALQSLPLAKLPTNPPEIIEQAHTDAEAKRAEIEEKIKPVMASLYADHAADQEVD
jgi:hypothetical protein